MKLSKVPKITLQQRENHLSNLNCTLQNGQNKEMSTKEKINFLKQEREFWEEESIREKYKNLENEKAKQLLKTQNSEKNNS